MLAVEHTTNGETALIMDTVITLEILRDCLPPERISEYTAKQSLLHGRDIKLKRDIQPHITSDTSFNELVEITEKTDCMAHSTGLYDTSNQHTNAVSNALTQHSTKATSNNFQEHHQLSSNNTWPYN